MPIIANVDATSAITRTYATTTAARLFENVDTARGLSSSPGEDASAVVDAEKIAKTKITKTKRALLNNVLLLPLLLSRRRGSAIDEETTATKVDIALGECV